MTGNRSRTCGGIFDLVDLGVRRSHGARKYELQRTRTRIGARRVSISAELQQSAEYRSVVRKRAGRQPQLIGYFPET